MKSTLNPALHGAARVDIVSNQASGHRSGRDPHVGCTFGPVGIELRNSDVLDELSRSSRQPSGKRSEPTIKVAELLDMKDIVLGLPAKGKRSALARMAARLGQSVGIGQGPVLAAMLRRERLGSTWIGHGVAIPHARLDGISSPAAMLATLQRPIRFDAPDNNPVDLLLAIVWPKSESTGFLPALAHLCRLLRHPEFRDRIRASDTPTEVLGWMEYFEEGLWEHGKKCFRSTQRMLAEPEVARA